jgi:hypothetical protein
VSSFAFCKIIGWFMLHSHRLPWHANIWASADKSARLHRRLLTVNREMWQPGFLPVGDLRLFFPSSLDLDAPLRYLGEDPWSRVQSNLECDE